uniref:Uncharacterized protein n=1 Tax=Physcomitrium patens TaxID=3218 RepID=A0A7I4ELN7_PHYPA
MELFIDEEGMEEMEIKILRHI